jgi:uncharacterized protein
VQRLIFLFFIVLAGPLLAQSFPDLGRGYVYDFVDLMTDEEEAGVREKLEELHRERDIEFLVVTIETMSKYGHSGEIEPFATGLFNHRGIGDATRNDGILMLVSRYDRTMRIEVGSGYGDSKNDAMAAIIDDVMFPHFRDDDYARGIDRGVDAIIHNLTGVWPGEFNASLWEKLANRFTSVIAKIGDWIFVAYAAAAGLAFRLYRRWKRLRPRICPVDGAQMVRLNEAEDDRYLEQGQIVEERLRSVDHDVWLCPDCGHVTIESYKSIFSTKGACRSCQFRTLEAESTVLESATTTSTGLKRIDYTCANCGDQYHTHATIPRRSSSSSSSSSGGSSGGSSSGGGASGSW